MARSPSTLARFVAYLAAASPVAARTLRRGPASAGTPSSAYVAFACASEADAAALRLDIASAARRFGLKADPLVVSCRVDKPFDRDGDSTYSPAAVLNVDKLFDHHGDSTTYSPGILVTADPMLSALVPDTLHTSEPEDALVPLSALVPEPTSPRSPSSTPERRASAFMFAPLRRANGCCTRGSPMLVQRATYGSPMLVQRATYQCWTPWDMEDPEDKHVEDLLKLLDRLDLEDWSDEDKSSIKQKFNSLFYPRLGSSALEEYIEHQTYTLKELLEVVVLLHKKISTLKEEMEDVEGNDAESSLLHLKIDLVNTRLDSIECLVKELLQDSRQQKKAPWGIVEILGRRIDILAKVIGFIVRAVQKVLEGFK